MLSCRAIAALWDLGMSRGSRPGPSRQALGDPPSLSASSSSSGRESAHQTSNIFHLRHMLSHFVTHWKSPRRSTEVKLARNPEWKQGTFIRFHTIFMASERSWLKDKAAVPGCAQPTYEHDGWLGARTACTTVLAETVYKVYMSWAFLLAFVLHSKSPQHLHFPSSKIHPSLSCRFAWRPLKPYEIATFFESLEGDFGTQGASGSVPQPGMGWRCAELFFLACWKLSPAVSLAVTCQTSIREPTWLDPLSNLHRHSTLQGRMCVVASRTVLVFWALLVQIVFSFWRRMDAEWLRMTQIPGTSSFQICQVNCQDVNHPHTNHTILLWSFVSRSRAHVQCTSPVVLPPEAALRLSQ